MMDRTGPGDFSAALERELLRVKARLAEAGRLLRECQPYVTLAVDNEYDGDKELVRGVAAFLGLTDSASAQESDDAA